MKLRKPPFPDPIDTGTYYSTQTRHRDTAIRLVIDALRALPSDPDPLLGEMGEAMRAWAIEAVFQGAWVRGYHRWEVDTKTYFDAMYRRNGGEPRRWKKMPGSHVAKVEQQLALFSAQRPPALDAIEETRVRVNGVKHDDSYLADQADYDSLLEALDSFWQDLDRQEEFTPPVRKA